MAAALPSPVQTSPSLDPRGAEPAEDSAVERVLFGGYCLLVGTFLLWAPWDTSWERLAWRAPLGWLRLGLFDPWLRAAVSAFGALHLFWLAHDLDQWWQERGGRRPSETL